MLCLGFSGGLNRIHENPMDLPGAFSHDGAAAIVKDGVVLVAVEEERLNRIKHSNKFPTEAIRYCLETAGARLEEVDRIAFYATESYCDSLLSRIYLNQPEVKPVPSARAIMLARFQQEFGAGIDPARISFVPHHLSHAMSAFALSGFEESLILAIDGYGDFLSGMVAHGKGTSITPLETFPQSESLGLFYLDTIRVLGYGPFDEYKVMGLAPYGDPAVYRDLFAQLHELLPDGGYRVHLDRIAPLLLQHVQIRRKGEPFTQQHQDVAAALQEALEKVVFHILRHRRERTGLRYLSLAGGVAHNCTMNGKLLYSGLFDDIFVQPAAHDAGCALGAALVASQELGKPAPRKRMTHVYLGRDLGDDAAIERELGPWRRFLDVERPDDLGRRAAGLIAGGAVIAWAQGRSEFGPRALGNRSILADPRPAENKERINAMVKKREGYRPFAPSVLEEHARELFELPEGQSALPFMIFVLRVREEKRALLGAITHVDGTARVHTVSREVNPRYWELIHAFHGLTGIPVVLNTSFNNNVEPIVDSAHDSVATFLTTGLDYLVVGPYLARKRAVSADDWLSLHVAMPPYAVLQQTRGFAGSNDGSTYEIRTTYNSRTHTAVSPEAFRVLMRLDGGAATLGELAAALPPSSREALAEEFRQLWTLRMVTLRAAPPMATMRTGSTRSRAAAPGALSP